MINLFKFQYAPNDQSLYYLSQIFGTIGSVLPQQDSSGPLILGVMFKTFNSIVLAVAALIVIYVTVVGVMKTAAEGEFLGKGWNSLWLPLRMVIGIVALVPGATGYSIIQIVMMWVVVQGIGAADTVWNTTLNLLGKAGSVTASVTIPRGAVADKVGRIFQGAVCAWSAHQNYANPSGSDNDGGYYCSDSRSTFCGYSDVTSLSSPELNRCSKGKNRCTFSMGPAWPGYGGACGTITYCNAGTGAGEACEDSQSIQCMACKGQTEALQAIVPNIGIAANLLVQADYDYRKFYQEGAPPPSSVQNYCSAEGWSSNQCCKGVTVNVPWYPKTACKIDQKLNTGDNNNAIPSVLNGILWPYGIANSATVGDDNFIDINAGLYVNNILAQITNSLQADTSTVDLPKQLKSARDFGWIFAGAYYYYIAQMNNNNLKSANPPFEVSAPNGSDPASDSTNPLNNYRNNYLAAGELVDYLNSQTQESGFGSSAPPALGKISGKIFSSTGNILDTFMKTVSGSKPGETVKNPLANIQALGESILLSIEILFGTLLLLTFILGLTGNLDVFVLGTGIHNPVGPTLTTIYLLLIPIILGFMSVFTAIGGMLAVYTPLIPYIIFIFGAIGWLILVIEAMIAAPLIALGIMLPSGHHEVLGKSEAALMLAFGIFLRPGLMIFGMIAGMLLSIVVVTMINSTFAGVMGQIVSTSPSGKSGKGAVDLLELIFFMVSYVMLIIAALNKSFALIHIIPDRVLRWIGGQAEDTGAGDALGAVKGGVQAAGGVAGGAMKGGAQAPGEAVTRGKKDAATAKKEKSDSAASMKGDKGGGTPPPPPPAAPV